MLFVPTPSSSASQQKQRQERQSFQWQTAKCHLHSSSKLSILHTSCGCLHRCMFKSSNLSIIARAVLSEENKSFWSWVCSDEEGQKLVAPLKSCFPLKSDSGNDTISTTDLLCVCIGNWLSSLLLLTFCYSAARAFLPSQLSSRARYFRLCLATPAGSGLTQSCLSLSWRTWASTEAFSSWSWCSG